MVHRPARTSDSDLVGHPRALLAISDQFWRCAEHRTHPGAVQSAKDVVLVLWPPPSPASSQKSITE